MKRFKFGLEKVMKLRMYHEQETRNELGRANSILTGIENNIKQNAIIRSQASGERFSGIHTGNNSGFEGVSSMIAWNAYINRLDQEAERLMEEAAQAEIVVEQKRNLYIEASRELKVMENLKEKREKEYRKEMFNISTREADDSWRSKSVGNQ